jgi:hypothetical protein
MFPHYRTVNQWIYESGVSFPKEFECVTCWLVGLAPDPHKLIRRREMCAHGGHPEACGQCMEFSDRCGWCRCYQPNGKTLKRIIAEYKCITEKQVRSYQKMLDMEIYTSIRMMNDEAGETPYYKTEEFKELYSFYYQPSHKKAKRLVDTLTKNSLVNIKSLNNEIIDMDTVYAIIEDNDTYKQLIRKTPRTCQYRPGYHSFEKIHSKTELCR